MLILFLVFSFIRVNAAPANSTFGPPALLYAPHDLIFGRSASPSTDDRTLIDITRSCLLTIAACVYHAIHPNIPNPDAPKWEVQLERFQVTILALMAPELVIFWAIRQWVGARLITQDVKKVLEDKKITGVEWTETHSHFTQMGGFCREDTKLVIFPSTLIQLLNEDRINLKGLLKLSKDDINDRSKGDFLSKGFVILQTTWFVLECITRWATDLPLTELEVVTLAYATLNVVTYGFWLHKPLNVNRPNYLEVYPPRDSDDDDAIVEVARGEGEAEGLDEKRGEGEVMMMRSRDTSIPTLDRIRTSADVKVGSWKDILAGLYWGIDEPLIDLMFNRVRNLVHRGKHATLPFEEENPSHLNFITHVPFLLFDYLLKRPFCYASGPFLDLMDDSTITPETKFVPCYYALKIPSARWFIMWYPSCIIAFVFASVHFLSWDSHFPTPIEQTLWRFSSVTLVAAPFDLLVLGVAFDAHDRWGLGFTKRKRVVLQVLCFGLAVVTVVTIPLTYTFARVCLMVQAVSSLRDVPSGAFEGIGWTSIFPHF